MIIVVEGNIGCGKSTVLDALSNYYVHKEQIDMWPLDKFYQDQSRWAFAMQIAVFDSMQPVDGVHERCPESAYSIFWDLMREKVQPEEDEILTRFYEKCTWSPDVYIYLRGTPEKCLENIQGRVQDGDTSVTLDYLKLLHQRYDDFFSCRPHTVIDATQPFDQVLTDILSVINRCRLSPLSQVDMHQP
jgi:deoxyadenosine/deoxycytidine kinase